MFFFCYRSSLIFRGFPFDFFLQYSSFPLLKGRQTPLSNNESVKVTKNFLNLQRNKKLPIDPILSEWVIFNKKVPIKNIFFNIRALTWSVFLEFQKLKLCKIICFRFACILYIHFSKHLLAMLMFWVMGVLHVVIVNLKWKWSIIYKCSNSSQHFDWILINTPTA